MGERASRGSRSLSAKREDANADPPVRRWKDARPSHWHFLIGPAGGDGHETSLRLRATARRRCAAYINFDVLHSHRPPLRAARPPRYHIGKRHQSQGR